MDIEELELISLDSLNFSNFVHSLYYAVQDHVITPPLFERIKHEYIEKLFDTKMKKDDEIIIDALRLITAEVSDEKA